MKKAINYFNNHKVEVIYAMILLICIILSIVTKSWNFVVFALLLYAISIMVEFLFFVFVKERPLRIETPDGYNEPYHPSVLFFENGWNGYKYWMAFTPMPLKAVNSPYTDRWECPCVYASNDGILFEQSGGGGSRFLDDLTADEIENRDYFSDTHLVYNELTNTLELYYRLTNCKKGVPNNESLKLLRKVSNDGINWSEREVLLDSLKDFEKIGRVYVSPAIIRENNEYLMWFVSTYGDDRSVSFTSTRNMVDFAKKRDCVFIGRACDPWHIDCKKIGNKYFMLIYEFSNELSIWESSDGITFDFVKVAIKGSNVAGSFRQGLYRACLMENFDVYFSAKNKEGDCLGFAKAKPNGKYSIANGKGKKSLKLFVDDVLNKYFYLSLKAVKRRIVRC